jgi:hypothetical protein
MPYFKELTDNGGIKYVGFEDNALIFEYPGNIIYRVDDSNKVNWLFKHMDLGL